MRKCRVSTDPTPRTNACWPGVRGPRHRRSSRTASFALSSRNVSTSAGVPEQISNSLRAEQPDRVDLRLAPESIYQALYAVSSVLSRSPRVVLRTGRINRRRRRHGQRSARFVSPMTPLANRPSGADDRLEAGHWEGDLVRHEALLNRAVVKGHRFLLVAASS